MKPRANRPADAETQAKQPRRPRIAAVLATVVLLPTLGGGVLAAMSAATRWSEYRAAAEVRDHAARLRLLTEARVEVKSEEVPSSAVAAAAGYGVSPAQLSAVVGIDYLGNMLAARKRLDANSTLPADPAIRADLARVAQLRSQLDAGHASYDDVQAVFDGLGTDIDRLWTGQLDDVTRHARLKNLGGAALQERIVALQASETASDAGSLVAHDVYLLVTGRDGAATARAVIELNGRLSGAQDQAAGWLGPEAAAAQRALRSDPATARFATLIDQTVTARLAGAPPQSLDPANFGATLVAFNNAGPWEADLAAVTAAAATDLRRLADHEANGATNALAIQAALAGIVLAATIAAAVLASRAIHRPVHQLGNTAREISEGQLSVPAVALGGPREIAETTRAVNDMTATLSALESYTVALADDPASPLLDQPLPGRTGRALQRALDRLRASIAMSERQRVSLEEVATHDTLTGLLNRGGALDGIGRDLARSRREHTAMTVLYIDVDDLKHINDTNGHGAGDEAIRLTAEALRATTRQSDIVARIGGDEFLVATTPVGRSGDGDHLAERIRDAVASQTLAADGERIPLHCSIGVAYAEPDDTVESVVHHADQALYAAKQHGRNTVATYPRNRPSARTT